MYVNLANTNPSIFNRTRTFLYLILFGMTTTQKRHLLKRLFYVVYWHVITCTFMFLLAYSYFLRRTINNWFMLLRAYNRVMVHAGSLGSTRSREAIYAQLKSSTNCFIIIVSWKVPRKRWKESIKLKGGLNLLSKSSFFCTERPNMITKLVNKIIAEKGKISSQMVNGFIWMTFIGIHWLSKTDWFCSTSTQGGQSENFTTRFLLTLSFFPCEWKYTERKVNLDRFHRCREKYLSWFK